MKKKGFSVIELMVVLAILAILAALIAPHIFKQTGDQGDSYSEKMQSIQQTQSYITVEFVDGTSQTFTSDRWDSSSEDLHIFVTGSKTIQASIPKTRIKLWKGGK